MLFLIKEYILLFLCLIKERNWEINLLRIRGLESKELNFKGLELRWFLESKALGFIAFVLRLESKNLGLITKLRLESKELESKVESFVWDCKVIVFAVLALTLEFVLECKTWLLRGVLLPPPPAGYNACYLIEYFA